MQGEWDWRDAGLVDLVYLVCSSPLKGSDPINPPLLKKWRMSLFQAAILFMGLSLPDHGYHAPNEYFDWGQASGGMKAFAHYFEELAKMGKR